MLKYQILVKLFWTACPYAV